MASSARKPTAIAGTIVRRRTETPIATANVARTSPTFRSTAPAAPKPSKTANKTVQYSQRSSTQGRSAETYEKTSVVGNPWSST